VLKIINGYNWRTLGTRRSLALQRLPTIVAIPVWLVALDAAIAQTQGMLQTHKLGLDFAPSYGAGQAVLNHRSIYSVADFVYPPLAAVAWTPIALLSYRVAIVLVALAEVVSLVFIVTAALRVSTKSQWWPVLAGLFSAALLSSDLVTKSLWLENLSTLLAPVALLIVLCAARRRWRLAVGVLMITLVIKPLLVPFLVLPLLARQWRVLALGTSIALGASLAVLPLTGGASDLPRVARYLLRGSNLVGSLAVHNLSLRGFGEYHHLNAALTDGVRLVIVAVAVLAVIRTARRAAPLDLFDSAAIATLLLLAVLLAGSLSEIHYLFSVIPGVILVGFARRARAVQLPLAVGGLILLFSSTTVGFVGFGGSAMASQARLVTAELILFIGLAAATLHPNPATIRNRSESASQPD
jgi:arabinofuranan 3-O-arabinosyltransferase